MKTVLILEDNSESRHWIAGIVARAFPQARIVMEPLVAGARAAIRRQSFDLALIDLSLPDGDGHSIIRLLAEQSPQTLSVVTTVMGSDSAVVSALSAGASGYLLKSESAEMVERHLQQISHGVPALSPSIARRIMSHFSYTGPVSEPVAALTQRETEVLTLIARGLRVSETAEIMGIADSTVASYIKSIYRKLGISCRAEATFEAARLGLLGRA